MTTSSLSNRPPSRLRRSLAPPRFQPPPAPARLTPPKPLPALFGWHGLSFEHPDEWAPAVLSGDRASGYARLASPSALSLQVRWAPSGREPLERALDRYLDRLSRDTRRKKGKFSREVAPEEGLLRYRYRGEYDGEGLLFPTEDGRVAFIEALGESGAARKRLVENVRASFDSGGLPERWSVLGLSLAVPGYLKVEKKEFVAGRTSLTLIGRGVRVVAERWGLAESLLARGTMAEWAHGRLGRGWSLGEDGPGLRGSRKAFLSHDEVLVLDQRDRNQMTLIRVQTRDEGWRPKWDWLT